MLKVLQDCLTFWLWEHTKLQLWWENPNPSLYWYKNKEVCNKLSWLSISKDNIAPKIQSTVEPEALRVSRHPGQIAEVTDFIHSKDSSECNNYQFR